MKYTIDERITKTKVFLTEDTNILPQIYYDPSEFVLFLLHFTTVVSYCVHLFAAYDMKQSLQRASRG